jgi:metal-responsive CopG/Arc/MetJ family transcriptional regulator
MDAIIRNTNIPLRLTANQLKEVDKLKATGMFASRVEVCRYMIQCYINDTEAKKRDAKIEDLKDLF